VSLTQALAGVTDAAVATVTGAGLSDVADPQHCEEFYNTRACPRLIADGLAFFVHYAALAGGNANTE
jgi:hypothetical protein